MKWSWKLGQVAGINVYVHATFVLLIGWIGWAYWQEAHRWDAVVSGVGLILALFLCVLLHEFGHALTAKKFGFGTRDITLLPIGGVAHLEQIPEEPKQELLVALAGPAVSLAIVLILGLWIALTTRLQTLDQSSLIQGSFLFRLMAVNLFLILFNLIPAFPMDGGRVLRALLAMRWSRLKATRMAATLGQSLAIVFGIIGLFGNPFLILIAVFVWIGAAQEASMAVMQFAFHGVPVSRAMFTDFQVLTPDDLLSRPVELMQRSPQHNFPVVENGDVVGLLTASDLLTALANQKLEVPVKQVMRHTFVTAEASDSLENVFKRIQNSDSKIFLVTEHGNLAGLITPESLGEFLTVQAALGKKI